MVQNLDILVQIFQILHIVLQIGIVTALSGCKLAIAICKSEGR